MPTIFHHPYTVVEEDIDLLGHASNVSYLKWMQDAAIAHSAVQGWTSEAYQTLGAGWVVRSHQIEYLQPAFAGDEIVVRTWVADMRKVTSLRRYKIVRVAEGKDIVLAVAATDWAFIHFQTRLPKRIPVEVSQAFTVIDSPEALVE